MTDLRWIAYLDGELPPAERAALEQLLAAPTGEGEAARRQLAACQSAWVGLERADAASTAPLREAAPLWPAVRRRLHAGRATQAPRPAWIPRAALAGTLAAGLALGVGLGLWFTAQDSSDGLDLALYTSLIDLPEGSVSDLYFASLASEGPALPDEDAVDGVAGAAGAGAAAQGGSTGAAAEGDSAEGLR